MVRSRRGGGWGGGLLRALCTGGRLAFALGLALTWVVVLTGWPGLGRWGPSYRHDRGLFLVDLAQGDGPCWRFVTAAARGLVKAEGLEGSGEGEEDQGGGDEDAEVEMDETYVLEDPMRCRHGSSFV